MAFQKVQRTIPASLQALALRRSKRHVTQLRVDLVLQNYKSMHHRGGHSPPLTAHQSQTDRQALLTASFALSHGMWQLEHGSHRLKIGHWQTVMRSHMCSMSRHRHGAVSALQCLAALNKGEILRLYLQLASYERLLWQSRIVQRMAQKRHLDLQKRKACCMC